VHWATKVEAIGGIVRFDDWPIVRLPTRATHSNRTIGQSPNRTIETFVVTFATGLVKKALDDRGTSPLNGEFEERKTGFLCTFFQIAQSDSKIWPVQDVPAPPEKTA
jgi:hypothetical protein